MVSLSGIGGRPALRVGLIGPAQELGQSAHLFFGDLEMRHLAASFDAAWLSVHPTVENLIGAFGIVLHAPSGHHIADFGREIGPLSVKRMAVDAGMALPHM